MGHYWCWVGLVDGHDWGEGEEVLEEALGVWDLLFGQAAVEVAEDGGEGGQVEAGLDYFLDEGVGEGLLFDLSAGPLFTEFVGLAFEFDLGEGAGHFTL